MQLTKAARFGLYALVIMADDPDARVSVAQIAGALDISESHVAKVLQQLGRAGLTKSIRGVGGGHQLARAAETITMLDIIECINGPWRSPCEGCEVRRPECGGCKPHFAACAVHDVLSELSSQAYFTFKSITVATLRERGHRRTAKGPIPALPLEPTRTI